MTPHTNRPSIRPKLVIIHDLQNPLAGIIAFSQVLEARPGGLTEAEGRCLQGLSITVSRPGAKDNGIGMKYYDDRRAT